MPTRSPVLALSRLRMPTLSQLAEFLRLSGYIPTTRPTSLQQIRQVVVDIYPIKGRLESSSRSWELCFHCLTSVNCYPLTRFTRWCETSQNSLCCSQLSVIMAEDKVITLGPNELPNLVSSYRLDDSNYLQWAQYIRTTLKGCKKLSYIEGNNPLRDDSKFDA
ncbi:hypothetical protein CR513_42637, partial [Mucuna pruriens]